MEKIKALMEAVKNDTKAMEMVKALGAPKNDEEAVAGYLKVAETLGFSITKEELYEGLKAIMAEQKAASDFTAEKISLEEAELEHVAGGTNGACSDTYTDGEWCWFTDSCSLIISYYSSENSGQQPQIITTMSDTEDPDYFVDNPLDRSFICQYSDNIIDYDK